MKSITIDQKELEQVLSSMYGGTSPKYASGARKKIRTAVNALNQIVFNRGNKLTGMVHRVLDDPITGAEVYGLPLTQAKYIHHYDTNNADFYLGHLKEIAIIEGPHQKNDYSIQREGYFIQLGFEGKTITERGLDGGLDLEDIQPIVPLSCFSREDITTLPPVSHYETNTSEWVFVTDSSLGTYNLMLKLGYVGLLGSDTEKLYNKLKKIEPVMGKNSQILFFGS